MNSIPTNQQNMPGMNNTENFGANPGATPDYYNYNMYQTTIPGSPIPANIMNFGTNPRTQPDYYNNNMYQTSMPGNSIAEAMNPWNWTSHLPTPGNQPQENFNPGNIPAPETPPQQNFNSGNIPTPGNRPQESYNPGNIPPPVNLPPDNTNAGNINKGTVPNLPPAPFQQQNSTYTPLQNGTSTPQQNGTSSPGVPVPSPHKPSVGQTMDQKRKNIDALRATQANGMQKSNPRPRTQQGVGPPKGSFTCDQCNNYTVTLRHLLTRHINSVHKRNLECDQCNLAFADKWTLDSHVERIHNSKKDQSNKKSWKQF